MNQTKEKPIQKCICFDKTFQEIKASQLETIEDIQNMFGCSTKCSLCRPYIQKMLQTGEITFDIIKD